MFQVNRKEFLTLKVKELRELIEDLEAHITSEHVDHIRSGVLYHIDKKINEIKGALDVNLKDEERPKNLSAEVHVGVDRVGNVTQVVRNSNQDPETVGSIEGEKK